MCESFERVNDRFEAMQDQAETVGMTHSFGGDEESLSRVLAFLFYGHELNEHERDQIFLRAMNYGSLITVAGLRGEGGPVDLTGSAYLVGVAHGLKLAELKENE